MASKSIIAAPKHKSLDGLALAFFGGHQDKVFVRRQMTLYRLVDQGAELVRINGIKLNG
jgi:hypothetical protein